MCITVASAEYVVICEGASSAILYVTEARKRGLIPIIVYPPRDGDVEDDILIREFIKMVGSDVINIFVEKDGYEDLLDRLKKYNVVAVVAGSEYGVRYADMLAKDLSLNGNNPDTTYMRCTKNGMAEALKCNGLRHIMSAIVKCEADIDRFWDENNIDFAFMKHNESASSVNSRICRTRQEAKDFFKTIADKPNCFGNTSEVLIQEYIGGKEYIVNTMSCRGKHIVTDMWVYEKTENEESNVIYVSAITVCVDTPELKELSDYALKAVEATGFEYGPCHGEYKIDDRGPVLIETNARPMGFSSTAEFLTECFGHSIADLALDTYIKPEEYLRDIPKGYTEPKNYGVMLLPDSPEETDVDLEKYYGGLRSLKTYRFTIPEIPHGIAHLKKTEDLDTIIMMIRLCGSKEDIERDMSAIDRMNAEFKASFDK